MSIVSIEKDVNGSKSIAKKIDEGSQTLVYDILQKTQYTKPIESTIRETVSNSIDAVKEKEIARLILTGKAKEEDYFIKRDDDQYVDSNFNRDYYDLNWFDPIDVVNITLTEHNGTGFCDTIEIKDTGVGLSPKRLLGLFGLGFSTKRNTNKGALGGFGLGAKSPLSTNVDFFQIETCYNGMKFIFHCKNHSTDQIIGKFNTSGDGSLNPSIQVTDKSGEIHTFYYYATTEKNNTVITIPSKKINRDKYIQAVKSQLLYFSNVNFYVVDESGYKKQIDFKANILYNSKNIILSDNTYYSKPHILIVKEEDSSEAICYGFIDFKEMEMQDLFSSVGVKCTFRSTVRDKITGEETVIQEGLSVVPSRESVIWDEHSRNYIINKFNAVQEEAAEFISEKLKSTDILDWAWKSNELISNLGNNNILGRFSKIVDCSSVRPSFSLDKKIHFSRNPNNLFDGFNVRTVSRSIDYNTKKYIVNRDSSISWIKPDYIFFKDSETVRTKDLYILESQGINNFMIIEPVDIEKYKENSIKKFEEEGIMSSAKITEIVDKNVAKILEYQNILTKFIKDSSYYKKYLDVVVPPDWEAKLNQTEEENEAIEVAKRLSPLELRRLNKKTILYYPITSQFGESGIKYNKLEPSVKEISELDNLYYGTSEDSLLLDLAFNISSPQNNIFSNQDEENDVHANGWGMRTFFAKVSANNVKHYKNNKNIKNFFKDITEDDTITMSKELINWYTARLISNKLDSFSFLANYEKFNKDMYDAYIILREFMDENYKSLSSAINDSSISSEIFATCDAILEMQLFARENNDPEAIKSKSVQLFNTGLIKDGNAVINEYYDLLLQVEEYCESISPLFCNVSFLITKGAYITSGQEYLINEILFNKNLNSFVLKSNLEYFNKKVEVIEEIKEEEEIELQEA